MFAALIPTGQMGTSLVHKDFSELFRRFHWLVVSDGYHLIIKALSCPRK